MINLIRTSVLLLIPLFSLSTAIGQFNEQLEQEILAVSKKVRLDGIEKSNALKTLNAISTNLPAENIDQHFPGKSWTYSHSVDHTGRKYRSSNGIRKFDFSSNGNAYFIKGSKSPVTTYCKWTYSQDAQLMITRYKSDARIDKTQSDFLNIHSISNDRLVITKVIRSKNYPGKSAILYTVYFRRE